MTLNRIGRAAVQAIVLRAAALHEAGDLSGSAEEYRKIAAGGERAELAIPLLASLAAHGGPTEIELCDWQSFLAGTDATLPVLKDLTFILRRLGKWPEAADAMVVAGKLSPDDSELALDVAAALWDAARHDLAVAELRSAAKRWPAQPLIQHQLRRMETEIVPSWHVPMIHDEHRNNAFAQALLSAVKRHGPDAQILDIGAGSGLLSMMAVRAGVSRRVIACERVPVIAETARAVIAANGYDEQITVITKPSTELVVGIDMERRADILVAEILSADLLSENVLASFEDARARLLTPDATILPRTIVAVGCLAGGDALEKLAFVGTVSGYDLQAFSRLAPQHLSLEASTRDWNKLSEATDLVRIDLTQAEHPALLQKLQITATADGRAAGILQWMRVDLDDDISFSNPPDGSAAAASHWHQILHTFARPIEVTAGQVIELMVGHDRHSLVVVPA